MSGNPWGRRCPVEKRSLALFLASLLLSGCYSYEAYPQDRMQIFERLQKSGLPAELMLTQLPIGMASKSHDPAITWTSAQAASWAVSHNPELHALRKEMGIAEAELVEAGLLPDPELSWDAMNVVAADVAGVTPTGPDYISGLGLMWSVPRPGEIRSKVGMAEARKEEVRQRILEGEWTLVRAVHRAWIDVLGAEARLQLNGQVLETAKKIADFFEQARKVSGATALQANLAAIEHATLVQERVRLQGELRLARQNLNLVLGLRPEVKVPMHVEKNPFVSDNATRDAQILTQESLKHRPDLEALFARYQSLEEALRLEVAKQWPELAIGTGLALVLPIFSSFNAPAIRTAIARRDRMARQLEAAVHRLRAEVHAAVTEYENERQQVEAFQKGLIPRIQENLRLTQVAFEAREVTLVEILTAQRQSLDTQKNYLEARIRKAVARSMMDTATGDVLLEEKDSREPRGRVKDAKETKEEGR